MLLPEERHGLFYDRPAMRWDEAFPLGNGILGALVWGDGAPLRISLDRTDLWDLRKVPEFDGADYDYQTMVAWHRAGRHDDLVRVYEKPYERPWPTKIPAGRIEIDLPAQFVSGKLDLLTATASAGAVHCLVHAKEAVGLVWSPESELRARLIAPAFGGKAENLASGGITAGDLAQLGYPAPIRRQGKNGEGFFQQGAEGFSFAACIGWSDDRRRLCWSVASSFEGKDPFRIAQQRVERGLARFDRLIRSHQAWWRDQWAKVGLRVPNKVIERQWYLDTYKFLSASRRGSPPITLQGPWTADDGGLPPWKGDYHHDLNTQLSYWPCYSGNRLNEGLSYLDWLWNTRDHCRDWTRRFFKLPGLCVPMTADLNNRQIGGWRQYTHSPTTAAWLAHHFYLHWRFSGDKEFLKNRAFPYLRECAVFIEAVTRSEGKRRLPLCSSPEINDNSPGAWFDVWTNYDLALCRWLMGATAELAGALGRRSEASGWRAVLAQFPNLYRAEDGRLLVAENYPLKGSHRHFSHLMALHPLAIDQGPHSIRQSLAELERIGTDYWTGYSFAWLGNIAAWAGEGAKAERALTVFSEAFCLRNSFHCNGDQSGKGHSRFTYRPFTLEGNFAAAAGLQEMLVQSHGDVAHFFPAVPTGWREAQFVGLRLAGAFVASGQMSGSKIEAECLAERGGALRYRLGLGEERQIKMRAGSRAGL